MSELPCEVGAAGGWLCEPGIFGKAIEQRESVIAGKADLGDGEFEHGGGLLGDLAELERVWGW